MKKNKLTFVIAATCLVLGTLVGCNEPAPVQKSSNNNATSIDGGSEVIGSSDNSGNSQTSQGGGNSSQGGGNTSQGGGNSSQGGGNTSQGGGDQPGKTDWTDAEKNVMKEYLHGYVLPFVNMDVNVTTSQSSGTIKMQSQQNMASGFLASYAAKFTSDSEWEGGDISSEYDVYPGNAYAFKRKVAQNGKNYYIAVMFTGLQFTPGQEEPAISKDGCFYLEAMDPYIYEYPAAFISQWMGQVYSSTIVPPAFQAEYYGMEEEGVLIGYSETNIEGAYKTALESSGNFTIDPNKNAEGYYVARPSDSKYVLLFKYDVTQKLMIIKVEAPKGWNVAAINAIFRQYNTTPFALPAIEDQNIGFTASALESAIGTMLIISVTKVNTQMVQSFVNGLKTLGYKVASSTVDDSESQWFTTANVFTNTGMFTLYITYSKSGSDTNLEIMCNLDANPNVTTNWPAASIARYLEGATSTVPAFAGTCYGYSYTITNEYSYVVVHVDEGSESAARDSYIATLTSAENGYVASGSIAGQPAFKSPDGHILVAISCNPTTFPGEIEILLQYIAVVDTPWPAEEVASGIANLFSIDPITDSVPALDVSDADDCYVNDNYGGEKIEICIDGLAASEGDFINDFILAGWTEDPYYGFDTTSGAYGALISPNKQLVAYFDTYSNDLSIYVKSYYEQHYYTWPADDLNTILAKWGVTKDTLPAFNNANYVEVYENSGEEVANILVYVGDALKQTVITDYCIALERIGYHFDEKRGGHISGNHELLIKFETDANGVRIIVSNITMVYRVVGYNGNWTVAEGLIMVDATNPDENYEVQYMASFHVDADAKFKVVDSDNVWYGEDNASYRSSAFGEDSDDNITVNAAGTVTVYFKIYEDGSSDMWLEFTEDPVVLAPWPSDAVDAILEGWGVTDEIPEIQDPSITDIQCAVLSEKSFAITVYGGSSFLGDYNDRLEESYTLSDGKYVSESGKLLISTHNSENDLIITVILDETDPIVEPVYKLVGSMIGWSYDDGIVIQEIDPEEGYQAQYTLPYYEVDTGEEFKITDGTGDSGWFGYEILADNDYFESNADGNIVAKQEGVMELMFNILADGTKEIVIDFTPSEVEDHSWATAKAALEAELPDGKIVPDLEVEGALAYDFYGSIDITFAEDADMQEMLTAVCVKLEAAGYHYSRRFMGFVNTDTDLCFCLEVYDNIITVICSENVFEDDEGFGIIVLTYDEADNRYYFYDECVGTVNPSNSSEYMVVEYGLAEGTIIYLYNFTAETDFALKYIDEYSIGHDYSDYLEYDSELKAVVVKQDFTGTIIIKLSDGNDGIYVELIP